MEGEIEDLKKARRGLILQILNQTNFKLTVDHIQMDSGKTRFKSELEIKAGEI